MSTILTSTIIESAKGSVDSYKSTINGLNSELQGVIDSLTGNDFQGDASEGYKTFYTSKVVPVITEQLDSLTSSVNTLLDNIRDQLLNTVDPQMGENNASAGSGAAGN